MHDPLYGIRVFHHAHPCAETRIGESVPEAGDDVDYHDDWEGRMQCDDDIRDNMAQWREEADPSLAEVRVDGGVDEGGCGVAGKGGQEDKGDGCVGEAVVGFEGGEEGADGGIVQAGDDEGEEGEEEAGDVDVWAVPVLLGWL